MKKIGGIILAAGSARRMGLNKLLLPVGGESLVRRTSRGALDAGLSPVVVVIREGDERIKRELEGLNCQLVENQHHLAGMSTSIRAGLELIDTQVQAVMFILADQPLVTSDMLQELMNAYWNTGVPLVASDFAGVKAPPHLWDRSLFPELLLLEGDRGPKDLIWRHLGEATIISFPEQGLLDVDTLQDYERIRDFLE